MAGNIFPPLDAEDGSAHTSGHRVRGTTWTCRERPLCGLLVALVADCWPRVAVCGSVCAGSLAAPSEDGPQAARSGGGGQRAVGAP